MRAALKIIFCTNQKFVKALPFSLQEVNWEQEINLSVNILAIFSIALSLFELFGRYPIPGINWPRPDDTSLVFSESTAS